MFLKAYFFSGDQYVRYDLVTDKVDDGYPQTIAEQWGSLPFTDGVDAALLPNNGKAYFFRGAEYAVYDVATDKVDGPLPIEGNWPGIPFTDGIDAVVLWNNGKAYFFKGSQYARYDLATGKTDDGYPQTIAEQWEGLPFTDGIDAAVLWNNGKAYFFKGDQYVRYDVATGKGDDGYPKPIAGNWPGITFSQIRAPLVWTKPPMSGQSQFPNAPAVSGQNGFGGPGVEGESNNVGVVGQGKAVGVKGVGNESHGIEGVSHSTTGGFGVYGVNTAGGAGVVGKSEKWVGVYGETAGIENGPAGVWGEHKGAGTGVKAVSRDGAGLAAFSTGNEAIHAETQSPKSAAIAAFNLNPAGTGAAIFAKKAGSQGHAGFFDGNLWVGGELGVGKDITLANADCAEDFDVAEAELIEPGMVMVLGEEGALRPSRQAYDKRVAGVISGAGDYKPGIVLDKQKACDTRKPVALLGKVYCKVDAGYAPVEVGDLLTTSPTPGHAMKAADPHKAFGAVIGKALRPLSHGQALVPILISLQ